MKRIERTFAGRRLVLETGRVAKQADGACVVQYGETVTKTIKTFLATWRPAGGVIRVVLVKEEDDWLPYFSTNPEATPQEILEAMADRGSLEQTFKDEKEVWGAGQQQVRNVYSNEGCFNLNLWMYSLTEAWAWDKQEEDLVDRSASPWDSQPRRPSHADKRKALQREVLRGEIEEALAGRPTKEDEKPPAKVWTYSGTDCELTIFFYADINTQQFRALTYEVTGNEATGGSDDQCLAQLKQGT